MCPGADYRFHPLGFTVAVGSCTEFNVDLTIVVRDDAAIAPVANPSCLIDDLGKYCGRSISKSPARDGERTGQESAKVK